MHYVPLVLAARLALLPILPPAPWLAGAWCGDWRGGTVEEIWSDVRAGSQVGVFRMIVNGRLAVSELMLLEQAGDSTFYTFQHFGPRMRAMDAGPLVYLQIGHEPGTLRFEATGRVNNRPRLIEYRQQGRAVQVTITAWSDSGPGSVDSFTLRSCSSTPE